MTPLKVGACLCAQEIAQHRDWLFDADRDIEIQDFVFHGNLLNDLPDRIAEAKGALDGHRGRRGIHGPFEGLDIDNKDPELRPLITKRFITALEAAAQIGATQMVIHSPYSYWYNRNYLNYDGYVGAVVERVHQVLDPIVDKAALEGITLVVENIEDVDPAVRRNLINSFNSPAIALSIDTGHAQLARRTASAPPVDYFVKDAGDQLKHVHIQDVDGHADRHWAPGEGEIEWAAVFRALADCASEPHLVLELRNKDDIPKGFAYLESLGLAI